MNENTLDPVEFLGKIGIYYENKRFFKVQIVGIRQPDLEYLFLTLQVVGKVIGISKQNGTTFQPLPKTLPENAEFEFGGRVDMMDLSLAYLSLRYVGELSLSKEKVQGFEEEKPDFWK